MRRTHASAAALALLGLVALSAGAQDAPAADVDAAVKQLVEAANAEFTAVKGDVTPDPEDPQRQAYTCTVQVPGFPPTILHPPSARRSAEVVVRFREADEAAANARFDALKAIVLRCTPEAWAAPDHVDNGRPSERTPKHFAVRENPPNARRVAVTVQKKDDGYVVLLAIQGPRPARAPAGDTPPPPDAPPPTPPTPPEGGERD